MKRNILVLIIGLVLGAVGAVYFLGAPRAKPLPGVPVGPPDPNQADSARVTVSVDEKFFDPLLGMVFRQLGPPQLRLSQSSLDQPLRAAVFQSSCNNVVMLSLEDGDVKTRVRFTGGKITAPVAFTGSYSVLGTCMQFKGWTQTSIALSFDEQKQIVFGRLDIDEIRLDNSAAIVSNVLTAFVRKTITERVNPFEVLPVSQLALSVPVRASGGSLKARVKDVRAEVQEGSLRLYLTYDFNAVRDGGSPG
jgi:hypothetical protein